jgi:hypothetical protein
LKSVQSSKNPAFSLAVERFNSAYSDSSLEDKIIDFAISYELLFSKQKEGTDSVTHKLAVRLSRFIAENYKQRISIYKTIKALYRKRSDIVHGNIKGSSQQEKQSVARDFEEYMRISPRNISKYSRQRTIVSTVI